MSYEGYEEFICPNGHYWAEDAYSTEDAEKCPACTAAPKYFHAVDQTNGYDDSAPTTCEAQKESAGSEDVWAVDHYGNKYAALRHLWKPAENSAWREAANEN